jgi:hypothetical protein
MVFGYPDRDHVFLDVFAEVNARVRSSRHDVDAAVPRFAPEASRPVALVELLKKVAAAKGATLAQIALVWLLAQELDHPDPWHDQVASSRRESWRSGDRP